MAQSGSPSSIKRVSAVIPALDGVRAFGVIFIIAGHCALYAHYFHAKDILFAPDLSSQIERLYYQVAECGWAVLEWFFVLSGLLITTILLNAKRKRTYFRDYFVRRIMRIFPAYYLFLLIYFGLLPLFLSPQESRLSGLNANSENQLWYWLHGSNFLMVYKPYFAGTLSHLWSLALEVQFYVIWPFVVYYLCEKRLLTLSVLLFVAPALVRFYLVWLNDSAPLSLYYLPFSHFDGLAAGAVVAILVRTEKKFVLLKKCARWIGFISGAALLILLTSAGQFSPHVTFNSKLGMQLNTVWMFGYSLLAIFFGSVTILLYAEFPRTLGQRFFSLRILRFIGNISYAMYLYHLLAIAVLSPLFLPLRGLTRFPILGVILFTVITVTATIGLAYASWHLCEKHFLRAR